MKSSNIFLLAVGLVLSSIVEGKLLRDAVNENAVVNDEVSRIISNAADKARYLQDDTEAPEQLPETGAPTESTPEQLPETDEPTVAPDTDAPTEAITDEPTETPETDEPTETITEEPTETPETDAPTPVVSEEPTEAPETDEPTAADSPAPTTAPSAVPTEPIPTGTPSNFPTSEPSVQPTLFPTYVAELTCTNTGGKVQTDDCCLSADDFPNTCVEGACGCANDESHEVAVCSCERNFCYDGTQCVPVPEETDAPTATESNAPSPSPSESPTINPTMMPSINEFLCTESGGNITTAECCEDGGEFPNTCLIGACGCAPNDSEEVSVCVCPEPQCFNGILCVNTPNETDVPTEEPTGDPSGSPTSQPSTMPTTVQELTCTGTGGEVETRECCRNVDDFPMTCGNIDEGICGCSESNSHEIAICICPEGLCYDGSHCVMAAPVPTLTPTSSPTMTASPTNETITGAPTLHPSMAAEMTCTSSGGNVTTNSCCLTSGDLPNTCVIGACGCAPMDSHDVVYCECPEEMCFDGENCVVPQTDSPSETSSSPTDSPGETNPPDDTEIPSEMPSKEPTQVPAPTPPTESAAAGLTTAPLSFILLAWGFMVAW